ncbi:MAG: hypothetical protein ACO3P0_07130 [Quisquiliibacterium sp.]
MRPEADSHNLPSAGLQGSGDRGSQLPQLCCCSCASSTHQKIFALDTERGQFQPLRGFAQIRLKLQKTFGLACGIQKFRLLLQPAQRMAGALLV